MDFVALSGRLQQLRRRLLMVGFSAGALWGITVVIGVLVVGVIVDLLFDLPPTLRIAVLASCLLAGVAAAAVGVITAWRTSRDASLARQIDRVGGFGGQVLTGWELSSRAALLPAGKLLAQRAVAQAARLAEQAPAEKVVSARPAQRSLAVCAGAAVAMAIACWALPTLASTALHRFLNPYADVPPFSQLEFEVTPGDTSVRYGDHLDIVASITGKPVDRADIVLRAPRTAEAGTSEAAAADAVATEETWPMFADSAGNWRTTIARLTGDRLYYVRTQAGRSKMYRAQVVTLPTIESVKVRVTPPEYTRLPAYDGPIPKQGLAGLPGTRVEFRATSNRPLSGGELSVKLGDAPAEIIKLKAVSSAAAEVVGEWVIRQAGKFVLDVVDIAGQRSLEPVPGTITVLRDERPFVRILQPPETSLATPTANIPVEVLAEDDYGVSQVQVFRSLNESRPLPIDLPLPAQLSRRVRGKLILPLADYGLEPGDSIKLFARVEDNDPAGAKGSESNVVTLQIISQEEFERLRRERAGMEVLVSKYRQAQRRLEKLADAVEGLKSKKKKPDESDKDKLASKRRDQLKQLRQSLRQEREAIQQAAKKLLPYDLDRNLSPELEKLAESLQQMEQQISDLESLDQASEEDLEKLLDQLSKQLAGDKRDYQKQVIVPLEHLTKLFPLVADQSRFEQLVARQKDLAERLASLRGTEGQDNPQLKVRIRELETEQRQLRQELNQLLDDIADHASQLPDDPRLAELKATAEKFVEDVRESGAGKAMSDAENALAEFAGGKAHAKATEAAEILEKFLGKCQSIGEGAEGALVFAPGLGGSLGQSVAQMLAEMRLARGMGNGQGGGGGGSVQKNKNVGLFGSFAAMGDDNGQTGEETQEHPSGTPRATAQSDGDQPPGQGDSNAPGAGGRGGEVVPLRYRQRVGQYFQRLADEAGSP